MGWVREKVEDTRKGISDVGEGLVEGVKDVGDFIQDEVIDPVKEFGSSLEDAVRDAADDVNKVLENPYVQMAVSIYNPLAGAVLSAYATVNSGDELSEGQIIALAAAGLNYADFDALPPETVAEIKKAAQVATADDPGRAIVMTYGADIARESGATEAFDNAVADNFGQETLDVLQQNEDYIVDTARFASGNMSEEELVAKYGAGAVDYATSGTALEDYNTYIADAVNVGVGNKSIEEVVANRYGEDIVNYLGADTENERAVGLGGLTTATQLAMGKDPLDAAYAGTKRAYDEGARLEDLSFVPQQVAGLDLNLGDILPDLGINFDSLKGRGYDLSSLANLDFNLGKFDFTAPDLLDVDLSLPEVADLGIDLGKIDFSGYKTVDLGDYNLKELGDFGIDVNSLNLDPEFQMIGLAQLLDPQVPTGVNLREDEELASLGSPFDLQPTDEPLFSREVLARTPQIS